LPTNCTDKAKATGETVTLHIHIHLLIQSSQSSQVSRGRQRWPRVAKGAWHVCPWREAVKRGKRDRQKREM